MPSHVLTPSPKRQSGSTPDSPPKIEARVIEVLPEKESPKNSLPSFQTTSAFRLTPIMPVPEFDKTDLNQYIKTIGVLPVKAREEALIKLSAAEKNSLQQHIQKISREAALGSTRPDSTTTGLLAHIDSVINPPRENVTIVPVRNLRGR